MANYKVIVPAVDVPDDWTNYSRELSIREDSAASGSSTSILNKIIDENEFSFTLEVTKGHDITVVLDLHNNKPSTRFKHTSGAFSSHDAGVFSIVSTDEPAPAPVVEPDPIKPVGEQGDSFSQCVEGEQGEQGVEGDAEHVEDDDNDVARWLI